MVEPLVQQQSITADRRRLTARQHTLVHESAYDSILTGAGRRPEPVRASRNHPCGGALAWDQSQRRALSPRIRISANDPTVTLLLESTLG